MNERQRLRMDAHMEGQQTIARNIGKKVLVSQMELVALCTFAEIGTLFLFSQIDGETGEAAEKVLQETIDTVRREFANDPDKSNGLSLLQTTCVALLRSERYHKYVTRPEREAP